jgi:hypothetical protein
MIALELVTPDTVSTATISLSVGYFALVIVLWTAVLLADHRRKLPGVTP